MGGHYQSAVPVRDSPILREFHESGGVDVAAMMNFDREPAVSELESTGDVTCFNPEQNSTRFPIATPAPATLEESCVADTTLSDVSRKRVLSPESIVLPPIKFRRMGGDWDLARRRSSTLTPVSTSTRSQVTITPPPITPTPPTRRMTRAQALPPGHMSPSLPRLSPLPAPQDHPGQGQTKGKNKKSYRLKCIQCNFISI